MSDQAFPNYRRYCLAKRLQAREDGNNAIEAVWQSKQEAEASTALPDDFPHLSALAAIGYTTEADLDGACATELTDLGMSQREARTVLTAFADL